MPSDFIAAPAAHQSKLTWLRVLFTRARTDDVLVSVLHKTVSSKTAASASTIRPPSRSTDAAAPPTTIWINRWSWTSVRLGTLDQSTGNRCRLRTRGYDALLMHLDDADAAASFPRIPYQRLGVELEHPLSLARRKASKGNILVITLRNGIVAGRVLHVHAPAPPPSRRVPMLLRSLRIPRRCTSAYVLGFRGSSSIRSCHRWHTRWGTYDAPRTVSSSPRRGPLISETSWINAAVHPVPCGPGAAARVPRRHGGEHPKAKLDVRRARAPQRKEARAADPMSLPFVFVRACAEALPRAEP
ncbi:hypothetical protein DFH08DRAFT_963649 [Mycena albidolilacea]|uniref:Uncharacterized protein n=1 Tax=Mycena albidolilacea TaxID=1033008 RepID=A0AAD7EPL0_9AGAR|nr:hypothetical protein DFH08DRAFT_963649 [Mycena albidolilacea]